METNLFIFFALTLGCLIVGVTVLAIYCKNLMAKYHKVQKENLYLRFHTQEKGLAKLNGAREKALSIVQEATKKAEAILQETQLVQADSTEAYKKQVEVLQGKQQELLTKAAQDLSVMFSQTLQQLEQEDINVLKNTTNDIKSAALEQVKGFQEEMRRSTIDSEKAVEEKVQAAFTSAQAEIAEYRNKHMVEIEKEIYTILAQVSKEVIGKRLTMDDQKETIIAALEKAKMDMKALG